MAVDVELASDAVHGSDEARVIGVDDPEFVHQQHAGVEGVVTESAGKGLAALAPGVTQDAFTQAPCLHPPIISRLCKPEPSGYLPDPIAGRPAQQGRVRMYALTTAILPDTSIRLEGETGSP
ncbi:hypothetical protein D3C78_1631160 [compost metagenome]